VTDGVFFFVAGELIVCGLYELYEQMRQEREDQRLPSGIYKLTWGSQ